LPALATGLVGLKVDVIIAAGAVLIGRSARGVTGTNPIVMTNVEDPIASGLVVSLARPSRDVTGLSAQIPELSPKRLQINLKTAKTLGLTIPQSLLQRTDQVIE